MRNRYHTFGMDIDLRDEALTSENLGSTIAMLLRDAADRIERGDRVGGFHAPHKGHSFDGGFYFSDARMDTRKVPPMKETNRIIAAIGVGELTRDNREEWRAEHLEFASQTQFDAIFEDFIKTKEALDHED